MATIRALCNRLTNAAPGAARAQPTFDELTEIITKMYVGKRKVGLAQMKKWHVSEHSFESSMFSRMNS